MKKLKITIGYLYGDLMNIYGDTGNIIALKKRAEWRGIDIELKVKSLKSKIEKGECDLFFFGGGQDQAQELVAKDLEESGKGKVIKQEVERGVPLLAICGGYQLLGDYYQPQERPKLPGIGLFPAYTLASQDRMIGNIVTQVNSGQWTVDNKSKNSVTCNLKPITSLVGFENHSGKTYLKKGAIPLGMVKKGWGNNDKDRTEGCIYKNAIGCYMHGSLLPKNPKLADWLLQKALEVSTKGGLTSGQKYRKEIELKPLDDTLENLAHGMAVKKFG